MLRLAEELLLLVLDERRGELAPDDPPDTLGVVFAGAVLMELALEDRIDTDLEQLVVTDPTPVGDDLLDPTLADIARDTRVHDTGFRVAHAAGRCDEIRDGALARLAGRGILESEAGGLHFLSRKVSRSRRYRTQDGMVVEHVRLRTMRVLFDDEIPDRRDIAIICLADACGVFERILTRSDLDQVAERIALVRKMDLIGRSVTDTLRRSALPPEARPSAPRGVREIPQAPGLPLAGNAIRMAGDPRAFRHRALHPGAGGASTEGSLRTLRHRGASVPGALSRGGPRRDQRGHRRPRSRVRAVPPRLRIEDQAGAHPPPARLVQVPHRAPALATTDALVLMDRYDTIRREPAGGGDDCEGRHE